MPTIAELGKILIASRVVSAARWQRATKLGGGELAATLATLVADPPEWWTDTENAHEKRKPPGLTDYQRSVIELWFEGTEADLSRQLVCNQFILLDKLGEGGQGEVYRARQINPGRYVAVKTLRQDSENRRQRFEQEARAMMKIQHGAVARFYLYERVRDTAGKPTDEYLIAMEYVDGNDLSRIIHVLGPVPWPFVARWAIHLLEGLAVIHQNGFIHRDVKPANVMVLGPLPKEGVPPVRTRAKLLDFGAVKLADEASGNTGRPRIFIGTREYAAPEQWEEQTVPASDIYALGATLFHTLTGQPPFEVEGREANAFRRAHARAPIPDLRTLAPDIPDELNDLIRQMLAKQPEDRGTATELVQAFREMLPVDDHTPIRPQKLKAPKIPAAPRPLVPSEPNPMSKPEPKTPAHAMFHPVISVMERIFLPRRLRPPDGHEPPLPERLAALLRRPLLLLTLLVLVVALIWLIL